jgi:hypothetical protein
MTFLGPRERLKHRLVALIILTSQQLEATLNQFRIALKEEWRIFPRHL